MMGKVVLIYIKYIGDAWSVVLDTGQNKKVVVCVVEIAADHINFLKNI